VKLIIYRLCCVGVVGIDIYLIIFFKWPFLGKFITDPRLLDESMLVSRNFGELLMMGWGAGWIQLLLYGCGLLYSNMLIHGYVVPYIFFGPSFKDNEPPFPFKRY
jgi:hypothetical protein